MNLGVFGDVNWLAVIVATATYFALGAVWFSQAAFGKAWARALDWRPAAGERPGPEYYIGPLITCLVAVVAVAMLAEATDSRTFVHGVVLGLVVGLGVAGPVLFVTGYFDPKKPQPLTWATITVGYHLVGLLAAAVIVSLWR